MGLPLHWPLEPAFLHALLRWARAFLWLPGQGQVTYMELALDFKEHAGRALPAAPEHKVAGCVLPLRERARVLKLALDRPQQFLRAGELPGGQMRPLCNALVPFGGYKCMGCTEAHVCVPPGHAAAHAPPRGALQGPLGGVAGAAGQGAPKRFPERLPTSPPGWTGAAASLQAGAPAAAALPARAATAAGAPGRGPAGARMRFGHRLCIVHCTRSGDVRGVYCDWSGLYVLLLLGSRGAPTGTGSTTRRGQGAACVAPSAPASAKACAHPPRTVLGSRGRESPRGSSEDEPPPARQRVLPPAVLGRRQRPPPMDSSSDDEEPPCRRPAPRVGSSFFPFSLDSSPHHPQEFGGRRGGR